MNDDGENFMLLASKIVKGNSVTWIRNDNSVRRDYQLDGFDCLGTKIS